MHQCPSHQLIATVSPHMNRATLRDREIIVATMADDFRVGSAVRESVTDGDMKAIGWTAGQLAQHGEAAQARARRLSVRQ